MDLRESVDYDKILLIVAKHPERWPYLLGRGPLYEDEPAQTPTDEHPRPTIVTAYFNIASKFPHEKYTQWMENMMSMRDPMIIFTSEDMVSTFERLRIHAAERTKIISMELNDMQMQTQYGISFWKEQHAKDPQREIHKSYYLYWIWNEKPEFLRKATIEDPFQSDFFAWVDIGYIRNAAYNNRTLLQKIPTTLKDDQILGLDVSGIATETFGGGFVGGYKAGLLRFHGLFYNILRDNKDEFIGIDQPWFWKVCTENHDLCKLIKPDKNHGDPWFFMAPYMMGIANEGNVSQIHNRYPQTHCLQDLAQNMPINKLGEMKAHHWDARTTKWNEQDRWKPMSLLAPCTIWYVGANTHGRDGVRLQNDYPCNIHVFEAVPTFAKALKQNWKNIPRSFVHSYGLGQATRTVTGVKIEGESTFAMETANSTSGETLEIRSVMEVWDELQPLNMKIDLLHANCEGCEWELWEALLFSGIMKNISIFQVGTHWFQQVVDIERRYCDIDTKMRATHNLNFKQAFEWERWDRKHASESDI
eukprot:scaffold76721_cov45-Cyclotella_meneghiniana.AAC.1